MSALTKVEMRMALMAEVGLDAFAQPAEVWLSLAVAAEARGHHVYQRDCERAMDIANLDAGRLALSSLSKDTL